MPDAKYDVVTIGAGGGAYPAALRVARSGRRVLLVDPHGALGGNCLAEGCVPSKAMVEVAAHGRRHARLTGDTAGIAYAHALAHKEAVQATRYAQHARELAAQPGVTLQRGMARFLDRHRLVVEDEAGSTIVEVRHIIVASGADAFIPPLPGADLCLTSRDLFARKPTLTERPASVVIIGGGTIGMETASLFAALGTSVTLLQRGPRMLAGMDANMVTTLLTLLDPGIRLVYDAEVTAIERSSGGVRVRYSRGGAFVQEEAAVAIMAIGRRPVVPEGFGALGLAFDQRGIQVDATLRAGTSPIYACGDVNGRQPLFHVAVRESLVAGHNILAGDTPCDYMDYAAIPNTIFTMPAAAQVGLTDAGGASGVSLIESTYAFADDARAQICGETGGGLHLFFEEGSLRLRGGWVVGVDAAQLIGEIGVAVAAGLSAHELARFPDQHPMAAEGISHAARALL